MSAANPRATEGVERPELLTGTEQAMSDASPEPGFCGDGPLLDVGRETCGRLDTAEPREWLCANGLGGFASGTVAGLLTRRYHGLLVAALKPPVGRMLLVAKLDETVEYGGAAWELYANRWADGTLGPARLPADRALPPRRHHARVDVRLRRRPDRKAHLDGAGRQYDLCALRAAARQWPRLARPQGRGELPRLPREHPCRRLAHGDRRHPARTARHGLRWRPAIRRARRGDHRGAGA